MGKLVCIGGGEVPRNKGGVILPYETKEIDEEIVRLAGKENPKFLFIGTASMHSDEYYGVMKDIYTKLGCKTFNLDIIKNDYDFETMKNIVFSTDIVYVGGGKTKFMLEKWKEKGLDIILKEAYGKDIVLSGLSAGSYCWFKYNYDLIEGLGLINAINCAHYDEKDEDAKRKFYNVIKEKGMPGIALDNCVALAVVDGNYKIIKSDNTKNAYKIEFVDGKFVEEIMK